MLDGAETGGRFALVQHIFEPRALAAPMHRHANEDEFTVVLEGRIGASLGGDVVIAEAGDLVTKPRGQWHTFWNAGDGRATVLELISPPGMEDLFRRMARLGDAMTPEKLVALAAEFGCEVDFEATGPLIEAHNLVF